MRIHILTAGFSTPNGRAVLYPMIIYRKALRARGLDSVFFNRLSDALTDCDVLIVEGRYYTRRWAPDREGVLGELRHFYDKVPKVFMFDDVDSSGWDHAHCLPYVTALFKNQALKDRSLYGKAHYGYRLHTDYAYREQDVVDSNPDFSIPVEDPELLKKVKVSWNSSLADYSFLGLYYDELYRHFPWKGFLSFPRKCVSAGGIRPQDVTCRYSVNYARETIAWQRKAIQEKMRDKVPTDRLSRKAYFAEMEQSQVVLSPFGYGEINYRDYETFLAGALLMKPDMSHMETWPDLYRKGETYISHCWDLSDFDEKLDDILGNYERYVEVAQAGQDNYRRYLCGPDAEELFCQRFSEILQTTENGS